MRSIFLLCSTFLLLSCQSSEILSGDVLLWYAADEADARVLTTMLADYEMDEPDINVVAVSIPVDELAGQYATAASQGLGPDIVLSSAENIHVWASTGVIRQIDPADFNDLVRPIAQQATYYRQQSYGVPLAVNPLVLYYNTTQINEAAQTLDVWLDQARNGQRILLHNHPESLFWGVKTFGGTLMDTEGNITLTPRPLIEWLNWLQTTQSGGDLVLSRDLKLLQERFLAGEAAYMTGDSRFILQASTTLTGTIRMAPLPAGQEKSGSLVEVETFMINRHAEARQVAIATHLIRYLTNAEQSATWLRETGRIPANQEVRIDQRLYPLLSPATGGVDAGIPYTNDIDLIMLHELSNPLFADVLSGNSEPQDAVCEFGRRLREAYPDQVDIALWEPICIFGEEV